MKLSPIPRTEPTIKHSFAFKQSTTETLHKYQELYASIHGDVSMKDLVEQILVDFMAEDKAFQKYLKQAMVAGTKPAPASEVTERQEKSVPAEPILGAPEASAEALSDSVSEFNDI